MQKEQHLMQNVLQLMPKEPQLMQNVTLSWTCRSPGKTVSSCSKKEFGGRSGDDVNLTQIHIYQEKEMLSPKKHGCMVLNDPTPAIQRLSLSPKIEILGES